MVAGKIIVCAREEEQYISYISLEVFKHFEEYIEYRQKNGEEITV